MEKKKERERFKEEEKGGETERERDFRELKNEGYCISHF